MNFGIQSFPQFHGFLNGKPYQMFKGAIEPKLVELVSDLAEQVASPCNCHKSLSYQ